MHFYFDGGADFIRSMRYLLHKCLYIETHIFAVQRASQAFLIFRNDFLFVRIISNQLLHANCLIFVVIFYYIYWKEWNCCNRVNGSLQSLVRVCFLQEIGRLVLNLRLDSI